MICVRVLSSQPDSRFLEGRDQAFLLAHGRHYINPRQTSLSPGSVPWLPPPPPSEGPRDSLGPPLTLQLLCGTVLSVYSFIFRLPREWRQGQGPACSDFEWLVQGTDWCSICVCKKPQAIHFGQKIKSVRPGDVRGPMQQGTVSHLLP